MSLMQIEQPFVVLPVMSFWETIKRNLLDMMKQASSARDVALQPLHLAKDQTSNCSMRHPDKLVNH